MKRLSNLFFIIVICYVSMFFYGCSGGNTAPNEYYMIDTGKNVAVSESSHKSIKVLDLSVSRVFDSRNLIYKVSENKFETDYYNRYFADIDTMVSKSLIRWLSQSSLFDTVLNQCSLADVDCTLEGHIVEIYGDFSKSESPEAVVSMQFVLLDSLARSNGEIKEWKYTQRVAMTQKSPSGLIDAYDIAFAKIFSSLEEDLISVFTK